MNSKKRDRAQSTFFSFAGIATIRGLTVVSQLMILAAASQVFEPDEFGRFVIAYALTRLLQAGSGLGAQSYVLKDIPYRQVHGRPWHSIQSALLYFVLAPLMICIFFGMVFEGLAALSIPFYPLLVGQGIAVATLAFVWTVLATLAAYVRTLRSGAEAMMLSELTVPIALLITMGLGWLNDGMSIVQLLMGASLLLLLIELLMLGWHLRKSWIPVGGPDGETVPFAELKAYWGTVLLNTIAVQADIVLAGMVLSPAIVGLYTVVKRMTNVMSLAVSIIVWMYAPKISRASAAENKTALFQYARSAMQYTLGPALIILVLLLAALPWWTAYFQISLDTTFWALLFLISGGQLLSIAMGCTTMFATQTGRPDLMVRALSKAIVIVSPLTLIAAATIGIAGVAALQLLMIFLMKWPVRRSLLKDQGLDVALTTLFRDPNSRDGIARRTK